MVRSAERCCKKETFATPEAAENRLRDVQALREDCRSQRIYECERGRYHLTSISEEVWKRILAYEEEAAEARARFPAKAPLLNATTQIVMQIMERDENKCVVCGEPRGLTVIRRAHLGAVKEFSKRMPSNLVTVCVRHEIQFRTVDGGWDGGWRLESFHDPERYPVLRGGHWFYLNNDCTVERAE